MTHADLIDRLKASSGPDERLGMEIICALLAPKDAVVMQSPINGAWCIEREADKRGRIHLWDWNNNRHKALRKNPAILHSLDACIGLMREVLPGWRKNTFEDASQHEVVVFSPNSQDFAQAFHTDECRAFLIAILQASMNAETGEAG